MLNRALTDDARATGILGRPEEALATAQRAFETYPDAARGPRIGFLVRSPGQVLGRGPRFGRRLQHPRCAGHRCRTRADRARLGELYRKAKGSEDGLGALCLDAYDRTAALLKARDAAPAPRTNPMPAGPTPWTFTLSGLDGKSLCDGEPQRQGRGDGPVGHLVHPLPRAASALRAGENAFRDNPAVVFLSIDADADRTPVKAFVSQMKWQGPVYFEDGLARLFSVDGLPATIVLDRNGRLFTHLNGFVDKTHFADLLTERIRGALAVPVK